MYLTLFVGALCLVFVLLYSFEFYNHPGKEERAGCFTLIVFLMSCDCLCSLTLPHGAVGWSAVCECGISLSYLLHFVLGPGFVMLVFVSLLVRFNRI